jgi:hypothetical protein
MDGPMEVVVDFAGPADDAGIRSLMRRQTMPGRVRMAYAREPDFSLGCAVTGDAYRIVVARCAAHGEIVGVACRSVRHVFLNGREVRIGYLGQLRVDERFRGRWLIARGFSLLREIHRDDPVPAYLASIVEGNDQAAGVLVAKRRRSFPAFRAIADYRTLAIRIGRRSRQPSGRWERSDRSGEAGRSAGSGGSVRSGEEQIAPASDGQFAEIASFLRTQGARRHLAAVWTEEALRAMRALGLRADDILIARRHGAIVGVMALWDQSAYKQSVVRGYSGWLRAVGLILPGVGLPRVGDEVRCAYASLVCIDGDDTRVFERLLCGIYNMARERRFAWLLIGLDARDPLLPIARAWPHVAYPSRLYLGSWSAAASHGHGELDERLAYVDIATL